MPARIPFSAAPSISPGPGVTAAELRSELQSHVYRQVCILQCTPLLASSADRGGGDRCGKDTSPCPLYCPSRAAHLYRGEPSQAVHISYRRRTLPELGTSRVGKKEMCFVRETPHLRTFFFSRTRRRLIYPWPFPCAHLI